MAGFSSSGSASDACLCASFFTTISSPTTGPSPRMTTDALTDPGGTSGCAAIAGGGVFSGIKRKVKQPDSEATPAPPSLSTAGIKRPRERPRKDQQPSQTTTNSLDLTLATLSDDAVSMRTKRLIARQTKETPPAAMLAPKTGIKRGRGRPRKDKSATPMSAETGGAMSTGIKRGRGRPRKDKPAAEMSAETGGAVPRRIKSRSRRTKKNQEQGREAKKRQASSSNVC